MFDEMCLNLPVSACKSRPGECFVFVFDKRPLTVDGLVHQAIIDRILHFF